MSVPHPLRNFILGNNSFIPSHTQYKRVILTGQLALLAVTICLSYILAGFIAEIRTTWAPLAGCLALSTISFLANRKGHYSASKLILASSVNLTVFSLCLIEPLEAGLYTFFIVTALGAIAVFGYEERWKATFFVALSAMLFLALMAMRLDFVHDPHFSHDYIHLNIIINFLGSLVASLLIIYFMINVNFHSESSLRSNEKQIQEKNNELVKLNTELDRFVYSTSHDLRAPISSIQGLIHLSRMTEDQKELRDYIDLMEGRLKNMTKFIGDISDYARNARVDLNLRKVAVYDVIMEILDALKYYPGADKVTVTPEIDPGLSVLTDPIRLHIILSNLISNSFKYADHRKDVPELRITANAVGYRLVISVKDNGVGIREQHLPRIFEMFFQATDKSEGSGLGLYIVKEAVEKLNGTIAINSQFGNGTECLVDLPVRSAV